MERMSINKENENKSQTADRGSNPYIPKSTRNAQEKRQEPPKRRHNDWWIGESAVAVTKRRLAMHKWRKSIGGDFGSNFLAYLNANKEFKEIVRNRKDGTNSSLLYIYFYLVYFMKHISLRLI